MRFHHHPWYELSGLKQNIGELFDQLNRKEPLDKNEKWRPVIDLIEFDEEFIVSAEIPGIEKKDIKLNFHESTLELRGERKRLTEEKRYVRNECYYGPFNRSIKIPTEIEQNKITANYQNGILLVHLPKKHDSKSSEIKIDIA